MPASAAAQIAEISRIANETLEKNQVPGLSIAIAKEGQIWSAAFGKADLENGVPATVESMFRTASIVKWMTATAAMRLVERGELDLDAPIQRYCPQFPAKAQPISSRQLLTHTSGIRHGRGSNGEPTETSEQRAALDRLVQLERATQYTAYTDVVTPLETFKNDPLLFAPGTGVRYSSLGYRVLGCVIEGAAHKPYRTVMRELVFVPAGMTSIREDDAAAIVPRRVQGYTLSPEKTLLRADFRDVSENLPAGGYLSTARDLVLFALAFRSDALVRKTTREQMLMQPRFTDGTPVPNPMGTPGYHYGLGIMVDPRDAQPAWFHTGGQSGVLDVADVLPEGRSGRGDDGQSRRRCHSRESGQEDRDGGRYAVKSKRGGPSRSASCNAFVMRSFSGSASHEPTRRWSHSNSSAGCRALRA